MSRSYANKKLDGLLQRTTIITPFSVTAETENPTFLQRLQQWREQHITDKQFTLLLSFVVGFLAAVAAYVLHTIIRQIQLLLTAGFDITSFNWLYLVYPIIGIYLTSLFVRYIVKDNISHGITRILYAIARKPYKYLKAIYILFLLHPQGIVLKQFGDLRGELEQVYGIVMPNRNEALARESIDNLCSPLSNTLNEYIAKIKRSFRRYVLNDRLLQQYVIAGHRGQPYRVTLPPEQVTLPAVFR